MSTFCTCRDSSPANWLDGHCLRSTGTSILQELDYGLMSPLWNGSQLWASKLITLTNNPDFICPTWLITEIMRTNEWLEFRRNIPTQFEWCISQADLLHWKKFLTIGSKIPISRLRGAPKYVHNFPWDKNWHWWISYQHLVTVKVYCLAVHSVPDNLKQSNISHSNVLEEEQYSFIYSIISYTPSFRKKNYIYISTEKHPGPSLSTRRYTVLF